MAHELFAPWAELVPGVGHPLGPDELLAFDDGQYQYELVEGRLVRMAPTGLEHRDVWIRLFRALDRYAEGLSGALVTPPDTGFRMTQPGKGETVLSPDIGFISAERAATLPAEGTPERRRFLPLAPDLAAEIASPDQYQPEMAKKAALYLDSGVRLVWVIWPAARQVGVWRPGSSQPFAMLGIGDMLDGGEALPGFTLPIVRLFS